MLFLLTVVIIQIHVSIFVNKDEILHATESLTGLPVDKRKMNWPCAYGGTL